MAAVSILAAAIAPGAALLIYFYLEDRYEPEPFRYVIKMFLVGVLIVLPTIVIQRGIILAFDYNDFWLAFFISGAIEEFMKWFFLYYMIFHHPVFDEPYDAIVYSAAVSLGFATLENIFYIWSHSASFAALLTRGLLPVSGHALFAVTMGYYMGKAKFNEEARKKHLTAAIAYPIFWHGLYDYILLSVESWVAVISVFMIILWMRSLKKVRLANHRSPFRQISSDNKVEF